MSKTIEERLEKVERELAEIKGEIKTLIPRPNWISVICGTFKDDPEFDEVLRLGKELREADQPKESDQMFVLDTDHLGILQRQTAPQFGVLMRRISQYQEASFFVTIVSFHEQVLGWNAYLARAKGSFGVVRGYTKLEGILSDFARSQVLPYASAAADVFEELRKQRIRIGTMDLRIGAIALANGMTVLTRNLVDFGRVPNLTVEDWTV